LAQTKQGSRFSALEALSDQLHGAARLDRSGGSNEMTEEVRLGVIVTSVNTVVENWYPKIACQNHCATTD
jgi:hypothetical protein